MTVATTPGAPLRVILVEDDDSDAQLVAHRLRREGVDATVVRITSRDELEHALAERADILLCDYSVPGLDALHTLEILRARQPELPAIVISGTIGEEVAVATMRAGAVDYLLKDRLERLVPAVRAAIERRRLERERSDALRSAELLLRLINAAGQGICVVGDGAGTERVVFANPMFSTLVGRAHAACIGERFVDILGLSTDDAERIEADLRTGTFVSTEVQTVGPGRERRWLQITADPMMEGTEHAGHRVVLCTDTTDRRRLEEEYRRAQKLEALGQLAGGIAHDFNNLLFVINAYAGQLAQQADLPDPVREAVGAIRECGERGTSLTSQLLQFSRNEFVAPTAIDVNAALRHADRMLARLLRPNTKLEWALAERLPHILWSVGTLERVVTNLVTNARDAMPDGGTIRIATALLELLAPRERGRVRVPAGTYVTIEVRDTGTGMAEEVLEHIFEPFFTTKSADRGTGLGLAGVYGMVTQAGGWIDVASKPGEGTTFTVGLPATVVAEGAPAGDARDLAPRGSERVLVAEDDSRVRDVLLRMLESLGYRATAVRNGTLALEQLASDPSIDLLVSDVVMPGMDGRALAKEARLAHPGLRVLLISGYSDDAGFRDEQADPNLSRLLKPFDRLRLATTLRELLARSPRRD